MPLVDLSSQIAGGAEQLAGPFGSIFRSKQFPSSYEFGKRFVSTQKTAAGGGNGVTSIDDPTYLGFSILFDITSPLFQGAFIGNTEPPNLDLNANPVGSVINALSDLGLTGPTNNLNSNAGFTANSSVESAVSYLETVGETTRATYLRAFIQGIQEINTTRPYYWQTIEGLSEAWNKSLSMQDPYIGTPIGETGEGITIGCLEALDLKISALFSLYKMAIYDSKYRRFILPRNLMNFDVYVYIQEIRKFQTGRSFFKALNPSAPDNDSLRYINENTSQIGFKFSMCNFIPEESGKVFDTVTNAGGNTFASTSIKWTYSNIEMVSQFSGYNSALFETQRQQPRSPFNLNDAAKKFGKDALANSSESAISSLERGANSLLQRLRLGNVFGLSVDQTISAIQNPQLLLNAANGAAIQVAEALGNLGRRQFPRGSSLGGNPLGEGIEPSNTIPSGSIFPNPPNSSEIGVSNIFGPRPSGPSPLDSTNVFG
jgi:hypothetical protein